MEIVIVLGSILAGILISRMYRKYRGPLFNIKGQPEAAKSKTGPTQYKELKKQPRPEGFEAFFNPPLFTIITDAEAALGKALNENQFNAAKNSAYALYKNSQEAADWQELNNNRPNNFNFADWQKWRDENSIQET